MWYAIFGEDKPDSLSLRKKLRPAHLDRLKPLLEDERVLVVGPHPLSDEEDATIEGFSGSLMIVDFSSLQEAQEWAEADPYMQGGVFNKITVKPFVKVAP